MRGEWIEIFWGILRKCWGAPSLPMRGEWIEILRRQLAQVRGDSLSPCGESGLKYGDLGVHPPRGHVSPHAGRVD